MTRGERHSGRPLTSTADSSCVAPADTSATSSHRAGDTHHHRRRSRAANTLPARQQVNRTKESVRGTQHIVEPSQRREAVMLTRIAI